MATVGVKGLIITRHSFAVACVFKYVVRGAMIIHYDDVDDQSRSTGHGSVGQMGHNSRWVIMSRRSLTHCLLLCCYYHNRTHSQPTRYTDVGIANHLVERSVWPFALGSLST